jgi:putative ABC transport system permease protein
MNRIAADFRFALRGLLRAPGFTLVVLLTLGLGIGANTTMFGVAEAVLWRPMPYVMPERLVQIWETNPLKRWTDAPVAPANFADWQKRNSVFTELAAYDAADLKGATGFDVFLSGAGEPQRLKAITATGNLFRVLGVKPLLGRTFRDEETFRGKSAVAVLSWELWQSAFGGDPGIVGRTISINSSNREVVGVMPRAFYFPSRGVQLWVPLGFTPATFVEQRRPHSLRVVARLKPGVDIAQAQAEMTMIAGQLEREYPDTNTKMGVGLGGFQEWFTGDARAGLLMLLGAVGFLLLIGCTNIANLQLGRAAGRIREIEIRKALGATRRQIVQQLGAESLLLGLLGGAAGLMLAFGAGRVLLAFAPALPGAAPLRMDAWVLAFHLGITLAAALVFGIAPAYVAAKVGALNQRSRTGTGQNRTMRGVLVACEVALSVMLVSGAGLLVKSLVRLEQVDPGFQVERGLTFGVSLPNARYPKDEQAVQTLQEIERRLRELPQVDAVGSTSVLALRGSWWTGDATVEGRAVDDYERELRHKSVTPDYFRAMGTPLVSGRFLTEQDGGANAAEVTLVNETLAKKYFRGADPIGKRIRFGRPTDKDPWVTVVGVVADEKQDGLAVPVQPEVYSPLARNQTSDMTFVIRSSGPPEALTGLARQAVHSVDKDLVLTDVTTLGDIVYGSVKNERFRTTLLAGFAGAALLLAAVGIYGVLAYLVTQRTREIGIRMAMGARAGQLLAMVFRQGMAPVLAGLAIGLAGGLAVTNLLRTLLFGVQANDPAIYLASSGILGAVAMFACWLPALRATRVDPMSALRDE